MKKSFILIYAFLLLVNTSYSQNSYTIIGKIISKDSGEPVPGASIQIRNSNKGTYSDSRGIFRLAVPSMETKLKIYSLGYNTNTVTVKPDTMEVALVTSPVMLKGGMIIGDIDANNVMKRAIEKKKENVDKIKTLRGSLYSKMLLELGGSGMNFATSGNEVSLSGTIGGSEKEDNIEKFQLWMTETFSDVMIDYDKDVNYKHITERRQTANMKADQNIIALGTFINFYDNNIKVINTNLTTPLADDALNFYNYKMTGRSALDDKYVYEISFQPKNSVFPGFEGDMKIIEGTYSVIEINLTPHPKNSIDFLKNIQITQKLTEVQTDIWYPDYMEMTGQALIEAIKGIMEFNADMKFTAIYTSLDVNVPLPDSIYTVNRKISVSPMADSTNNDFWKTRAPMDLTPKEQYIYTKVDSLVALDTSTAIQRSSFNWDVYPLIEYNRVESASLQVYPSMSYDNFSLNTSAEYSFGIEKAFGSAQLNYYLPVSENDYLKFFGSVFSEVGHFGPQQEWPLIANSLSFLIFGDDYYDYFHKDGWRVGVMSNFFGLNLTFENSRHFSLDRNTDYSFFSINDLRDNPEVDPGNYYVLAASANTSISKDDFMKADIFLTGFYGTEKNSLSNFWGSSQRLDLEFPLFETGYEPMTLNLSLQNGISADDTPAQYLYKMNTNLGWIAKSAIFFTAPPSIFGGDYRVLHAEFNTSDLWWRFLRIPTFENGRGIKLSLNASYGSFDGKGFYQSTRNASKDDLLGLENGYLEAGFGLKRIPTFVSNIIYLGFDARWRITDQPMGDVFGWGVSMNFPF